MGERVVHGVEDAAREYCRVWDERSALIKQRRELRCEEECRIDGVYACWRGGRLYYDSAHNEVEGEWCEPCQQGRALTEKINKLTRKIVGKRTRMLNAARRTP